MSPIGQLDVFVFHAREVVLAYINPSICDVVNVGEDRLVDHNLVGFICVTNRIDRAFRCRSDRRDVDIDRVNPKA